MRSIIKAITLFITTPLLAATIGNTEYQLPKKEHGWTVAKEFSPSELNPSSTIIYIPKLKPIGLKKSPIEENPEIFSAYFDTHATDLSDEESLKKELTKGLILFKYKKPEVAMTVLERTTDSLLLEWSITDFGQEKARGWIRIFSTSKTTSILMAETDQIDQLEKLRPVWIQALKEAKLLNK